VIAPVCLAAVLLSVERIAYVLIWRNPAGFRRWSTHGVVAAFGGPVDLLAILFAAFKLIQIAVFAGWHVAFGDGTLWPQSRDPRVIAAGALFIVIGQALNLSVFMRLGRVGVFYGNKFGHPIAWCRTFPFTWFEHPQYVGTVLAIWGLFFAMRFPSPDWIVLPLLESLYYAAGARLERDAPGATAHRDRHEQQDQSRHHGEIGQQRATFTSDHQRPVPHRK